MLYDEDHLIRSAEVKTVFWALIKTPTAVLPMRGKEMPRNHSFGSTPFLSIGVVIVLAAIFMFVSCSKKNPVDPNSKTDIDGNTYRTIKIGNQYWMAENLKVTRYRNGDAIPNVTDGETWAHLTAGAFCNYDNNANNVTTYGRLYNWYAVIDSRNIAPAGWHVPSDADWKTLARYLGGEDIAGGKMKETGTTHWQSPNTGATNESGFSALPGGERSYSGVFNALRLYANFWSSSEVNTYNASYWDINHDTSILPDYFSILSAMYEYKQAGFSIRLVRD
jgi:uncharacterized protein (TIGR02145 family)